MGAVYEAYQESMRRKVALKVLDSSVMPSRSEASRFEREAWIGGRLSHPNIVKVYSRGVEGTAHFIAMEFVEGNSLAAEIMATKKRKQVAQPGSESNRLSGQLRRMVSLFVGVSDALQHVHEQGIVHRDIKPSNLLLSKDGSKLLVSDFGLARDEQASRMTRRGDFMGTIRYMSPEQLLANRARVDYRSDIWSLGVSLYEAVTLDFPYAGESEEAYVTAVSMKDPIPARKRNQAVPRDLETVLMKCLERDPERRYATMATLREDLILFLKDRPVMARRPGMVLKSVRSLRRNRGLVASTTAGAILALALAGLSVRTLRARQDEQRIQWTLEQVSATGSEAETLEGDWPRLEMKLRQMVRSDPDSKLSLLALRAAPVLKVELPSYGLLSNLPKIRYSFSRALALFRRAVFVWEVEGSWDGGPWKSFGACFAREVGPGLFGGSILTPIGTSLSDGEVTEGPHRLDLRATFSAHDARDVTLRVAGNVGGSCASWDAGSSDWRKDLIGRRPLTREVKGLGSFSVNLFKEYPETFPAQVGERETTKSMESWFRVDLVRVVCVRLPTGAGSRFSFQMPKSGDREVALLTDPSASGKRLIAGIEMLGRMDPRTPFPVAADARLRDSQSPAPILRFPLAFGPGVMMVGESGKNPWQAPLGWAEGNDGSIKRLTIMFQSWSNGPLTLLQEAPLDGIRSGKLDLIPSREVALTTTRLEHYLGAAVSIPVRMEIVTVDGDWVVGPSR